MNQRARSILWLDGCAGGFVGLLMMGLHDWLAGFYQLPLSLIVFIAAMNLVYACYSLRLAILASRGRVVSRRAVEFLVVGNLGWTVSCLFLLIQNHQTAGVLGLGHIALEGLFVAVLAGLEVRYVRPCAGRGEG